MNILVTADTHLPTKTKELPEELLRACKQAELIIHAGDWSELEVVEQLSTYAKVIGVYGNVDSNEVRMQFPKRDIIEVNGFRIGITHGHGENKTTERRVLETFAADKVDIIIFGHSHIPIIHYVGKIMIMNPGSPTYKRKLPYYSYGVLEIGQNVNSRLVFFN